ncbi:MAG: SufD family Fe-S cluster assembly protein [Rikenellaceae bacterium]
MQQILHYINYAGFTPIVQGVNRVAAGGVVQLSAINPAEFSLSVEQGATAEVVLLHGSEEHSTISIELAEGAVLRLTQLLVGNGEVNLAVNHAQGANSDIVAVSLKANKTIYNLQLSGADGYSHVNTLQAGSSKDNNSVTLNMRHESADCSSRSLSKCVASAEASLHFDGLVYVAQDAQRTVAEQNCRSIMLSDTAHIEARPQLEIYADDVKCSHGATMGQVDTDAILYMRQRGLSEAQARRVQIEGFVTDLLDRVTIEELRESLRKVVIAKLEEM